MVITFRCGLNTLSESTQVRFLPAPTRPFSFAFFSPEVDGYRFVGQVVGARGSLDRGDQVAHSHTFIQSNSAALENITKHAERRETLCSELFNSYSLPRKPASLTK